MRFNLRGNCPSTSAVISWLLNSAGVSGYVPFQVRSCINSSNYSSKKNWSYEKLINLRANVISAQVTNIKVKIQASVIVIRDTIWKELSYLHLYFSGIFTLCWGLASLVLYKLYPIKAQLFFLIDTSHLLSEGEDKSTASPLKLREVSPLVNFPCPLQMHFRGRIDQVWENIHPKQSSWCQHITSFNVSYC